MSPISEISTCSSMVNILHFLQHSIFFSLFQHERRGSLNLQLDKGLLDARIKRTSPQRKKVRLNYVYLATTYFTSTQVRSHSLLKLRTPSPSLLAQVNKNNKIMQKTIKMSLQNGQSPIKLKTGAVASPKNWPGKHLWIRCFLCKIGNTFVTPLLFQEKV